MFKSLIIDYFRCQAMHVVSLWSPNRSLATLINYMLEIIWTGISRRVFASDVNPDGSICVSVAAPDTESSVDKRD